MKILIIFPILISLYLINCEPLYSGSFIEKEITNEKNKENIILSGYKFYSGTLILEKNDNIIFENKKKIFYSNIDNSFNYPKSADETAIFFLEAVILEIPKDINKLSANRTFLDKQILKNISSLKYKENISSYFSYKQVYNSKGKILYQFEFDFNLDRRSVTYFIMLNNRNGQWQVEEIAKEKQFLLK